MKKKILDYFRSVSDHVHPFFIRLGRVFGIIYFIP